MQIAGPPMTRDEAKRYAEKKLADIHRRYPSATDVRMIYSENRFIVSYRWGGATYAGIYDYIGGN